MAEIVITLKQLRQMIGVQVRYRDCLWQVIEVLEDGPSLVLECVAPTKVLQPDQYGEGYRRVPQRTSIPVLTRDRRELHPEFLELDLE